MPFAGSTSDDSTSSGADRMVVADLAIETTRLVDEIVSGADRGLPPRRQSR
jgi:hypothetical protein